MIAFLRGRLLEKHPNRVVVDVNGVGYDVQVPVSSFYGLGEAGSDVALRIHTHVREDAIALFGFGSVLELQLFERLIAVSGIGPKVALAVLSGLSVDDLAAAIASEDATRLTRVPGIGKKTAERLVLELRDKLPSALPAVKASDPHGPDVLNALLSLGYNAREASVAIRDLPPDLALADAIRQALKGLAKP
jgi:holliday junction DNA helicase RuvA